METELVEQNHSEQGMRLSLLLTAAWVNPSIVFSNLPVTKYCYRFSGDNISFLLALDLKDVFSASL